MPKVSVILVLYNSRKFLLPVYQAVFNQTHKDLEVLTVINASDDGTREFVQSSYPQTRILDEGVNTGFAGGNNWAIRESSGEFIQLVNPDLIMQPDYIERMLAAFNGPKVAAATGKLLRYDFDTNEKSNIIDSTGITLSISGRGRDRGQLQEDKGQFDSDTEIFGVSGAAPMYRRNALEAVKFGQEYFDEDFGSYWEDVDLSWRLNNAGYKNIYVPEAVAYHGRTAGQSKGGYLHVLNFIRHHGNMPPHILKLNYKNHLLMYLKNAPHIHPAFILREIAMLAYILVFETGTLKVVPEIFRLYPRIRQKRNAIFK
jgi:GT2 family glycosyltransferase